MPAPPPERAVARRTRSAYTPAHARQAERLCRLGATNVDLADIFGVSEKTVRNWMRRQKPFADAVRRGKGAADLAVADSLYRRACGFSHTDVRMFRRGSKVITRRYTRHYPPDTTACVFWLKNRRPDLWREAARAPDRTPGAAAPSAGPPRDDLELARRLAFLLATADAALPPPAPAPQVPAVPADAHRPDPAALPAPATLPESPRAMARNATVAPRAAPPVVWRRRPG